MRTPTEEEINMFIAESNAIEGIFEVTTHPLVVNHKEAVELALETTQRNIIPDPLAIHRILMKSELEKNPGQYRTVNVVVGRNKTPLPQLVSCLMSDLINRVHGGPEPGIDPEQWIWDVHYEFECIHPFIDGNGRVGRIWMNSIRLSHGLSWLIILARERRTYYYHINVFRWENSRYRQYSAGNPAEDVETMV